MSVSKIDGIGTRKNGSGGFLANRSQGNARFVRLFAKETLAKGDCVCFDIDSTIDSTDSTDYGYGNIVEKADRDTLALTQVIGVAAEAVTVSADDVTNAAWKPVLIQVSGRCDFVKVEDNIGGTYTPAAGDLLVASSTAGSAQKKDVETLHDVALPFAIHLEIAAGSGTAGDNLAGTKALLINPANL